LHKENVKKIAMQDNRDLDNSNNYNSFEVGASAARTNIDKHRVVAMRTVDTTGTITNEQASTNRSRGGAFTSMASTHLNLGSSRLIGGAHNFTVSRKIKSKLATNTTRNSQLSQPVKEHRTRGQSERSQFNASGTFYVRSGLPS
jgi:hypothetical protein